MFARVTRSSPCPICGRTDWCSYEENVALCMREGSVHPTQNGGWLHKLTEKHEIKNPEPPPSQRKPDQELDKIYRKLLDVLSLSEKHKNDLASRGMTEFEIKMGRYRTLPESGRDNIINRLNPSELHGIPGFGYRNGHLVIAGRAGLMIPHVSPEGLLVSFTIRPDDQLKSKYIAFSSSWLEAGASPGGRLHMAVPPAVESNILWITEGPLKANIAASRLKARVLSVPGVSNWKKAIDLNMPRLVVVAYDNDYEKHQVQFHARKLSNALIKKGHIVYAAFWGSAKGLDDALVEGIQINLKKITYRKGRS